jgi:hypothetical protein
MNYKTLKMIQRIQSVYLTVILLLSLIFFTGSVFNCVDETGQAIKLTLSGNLTDQSGQSFARVTSLWPLTAILVFLALMSLVTILMFRNRKIQLKLALSVIALSSGLIITLGVYYYIVTHSFRLSIVPGLNMAIPVLAFVLSILAYRGILKDDRLVKSYDRLR